MDIVNRETLFEGNFLKIIAKTVLSKDNDTIVWETIERNSRLGNNASLVVPVTAANELIMVKQWRAATESFIVQLPGGLQSPDDESAEETARRELFEETGYTSSGITEVFKGPAFPILTASHDTYFLARNVTYVGGNKSDVEESLETVKISLNDLFDYLMNLPPHIEFDLRLPGTMWMIEKMGLLSG